MARRHKPLHPTTPQRDAYLLKLRPLHDEAGLTLEQVADRCDRSQASLSRALSGKYRPTWETIREYLRGCGLDPQPWEAEFDAAFGNGTVIAMHRSERSAGTGSSNSAGLGSVQSLLLPPPGITRLEDLLVWLEMLLARSGMSLREAAEKIGRPHTTIHYQARRTTMPKWKEIATYIAAFGITEPDDVAECRRVWLQVCDAETLRRCGRAPEQSPGTSQHRRRRPRQA